jgi:hypothetical protein
VHIKIKVNRDIKTKVRLNLLHIIENKTGCILATRETSIYRHSPREIYLDLCSKCREWNIDDKPDYGVQGFAHYIKCSITI